MKANEANGENGARVTETLDSGDHVGVLLEPLVGSVGPWEGQLGFQAVKDLDPGHDA